MGFCEHVNSNGEWFQGLWLVWAGIEYGHNDDSQHFSLNQSWLLAEEVFQKLVYIFFL